MRLPTPSLVLIIFFSSPSGLQPFSSSTSCFWGGLPPPTPPLFLILTLFAFAFILQPLLLVHVLLLFNSYSLCVCLYFAFASFLNRNLNSARPPLILRSRRSYQKHGSQTAAQRQRIATSQGAEALGFQAQKVLPRPPALNAGGAAAKNTKPRGQDEAVRGPANMPRGQANRSRGQTNSSRGQTNRSRG